MIKRVIKKSFITFGSLIVACNIGFGILLSTGCSHEDLSKPSKRQLAWHQLEQTAFVHFGVNTFEGHEWGWGNESPMAFNPEKLDAEQWVRNFKECGFKQVVLTCKHHDGFCLWPSKYTDRSVISSLNFRGGHGDVVREVSNACHKYGLKFGIYFSPWDRSRGDFTTPHYIDYYCNQLTELLTNYGKISEVWFDCDAYNRAPSGGYYGGAGGDDRTNPKDKRTWDYMTYYQWDRIFKIVRKLQPDAVMSQGLDVRTVGNELGIMGDDNWDNFNCTYPEANKWTSRTENEADWKQWNIGQMDGKYWLPAECDTPIAKKTWFWNGDNGTQELKSSEDLFDIYMRSVGRGAGLILNIPPDDDGLIPDDEIALLHSYKNLLDTRLGNKLGYVRNSNELNLKTNKTLNYIILQENIKNGQKIKSFEVQTFEDGQWKNVDITDGHWDGAGYPSFGDLNNHWASIDKQIFSSIGYKRILKFKTPITTNKIRINILDSKNNPQISNIEVY